MLLVEFPSEILLAISGYLEYECDLNALSQASSRLYAAVNPRLYQHLLQNPPSPALEWAAEHWKEASVRRLLEAGVPPDTTRHQLWMPIVVAARRGHAEIVQQFLDHGVDPNPTSGFYKDWEEEWWDEGFERSPENPLTVAVRFGHESVVWVLINHGVDVELPQEPEEIDQPLNLAVRNEDVSLINLLLERGCNPQYL